MSNKIAIREIDTHSEFLANGRKWFIATTGIDIIGMASITGLLDDFPWMNDLFVEPNFRRKGIARRLVEARLRFAQTLPTAKGVNMAINRSNEASIALVESCGFVHAMTYADGDQMLFVKTWAQDASA